jgi:hypothetical protein
MANQVIRPSAGFRTEKTSLVPVPELTGNFFEGKRRSIKDNNQSVFDKGSNLTRKTT